MPSIKAKFSTGSPRISNPWGKRSSPEYLLLKRSFGTRTRGMQARKVCGDEYDTAHQG